MFWSVIELGSRRVGMAGISIYNNLNNILTIYKQLCMITSIILCKPIRQRMKGYAIYDWMENQVRTI
jgi:hypothetical protein